MSFIVIIYHHLLSLFIIINYFIKLFDSYFIYLLYLVKFSLDSFAILLSFSNSIHSSIQSPSKRLTQRQIRRMKRSVRSPSSPIWARKVLAPKIPDSAIWCGFHPTARRRSAVRTLNRRPLAESKKLPLPKKTMATRRLYNRPQNRVRINLIIS